MMNPIEKENKRYSQKTMITNKKKIKSIEKLILPTISKDCKDIG